MPEVLDAVHLKPRQLRYVLTLAELRSFRRAAAFLAIPPGLLSREIAEIERVFGALLFDRLPDTSVPTPAGAEIAEMARRTLAGHRAANEDLAGDGACLRVGWVDFGRGQAIQRAALAEFRAQYPRIPVQLATAPYRDQLQDMETGFLKAGFYPGTNPRVAGLATEVLLPDTLACVMLPSGHRLAEREVLALTDLSGFPLHSLRTDYAPELMATIHDGVSRGGWRGQQTTGSAQPSEVVTMIACGAAWTPTVTDMVGWAPPGVEVRPLADGSLTELNMHVMWLEDDPMAVAFVRLVCELRDAMESAVPRSAPPTAPPRSGSRLVLAGPQAEIARREREMNDSLLQDMLGSELQLEAVRRRLPRGLARESRDLQDVVDRLERAARRGRKVLESLVPGRPWAGGLASALSIAAEELRSGSGAEFRIEAEGPVRELRAHVEEAACWLGIEAIANAFRHAGAALVSVTLGYGSDFFTLRVADTGEGIDPRLLEEGRADGGMGLGLMRERAGAAGGALVIRGAPGAGTVVEMSVPAASAFAYPAAEGTPKVPPLDSRPRKTGRNRSPDPKRPRRGR